MHLIQILLPTRDGEGKPLPGELFEEVWRELAEHFGQVTAHMRVPASAAENGAGEGEDVVVFEVTVERLEREYWRLYRLELQEQFGREITIRSQNIVLL